MKYQAIAFVGNLAMLGFIWNGSALPGQTAAVVTLYDGNSGVTPDQYNAPNPYLGFATIDRNNPFGAAGTQNVDNLNQSTVLASSTSESFYSGYYNYQVSVDLGDLLNGGSVIHPAILINNAFPVLDRQAGYDLTFTAKMDSQTNNGNNGSLRAGFNILVLSSDQMGIEIGFRNPNTKATPSTPDIFSQDNRSFNVIGEVNNNVGGILDDFTTYNLQVRGDQYRLSTGSTLLLNGNLRNYSSTEGFGSAVYQTPNFLFLGDNTTSAGGTTQIRDITVTNVPEPLTMLGSAGAIAFLVGFNRMKNRD
jgi:hypothetical protein